MKPETLPPRHSYGSAATRWALRLAFGAVCGLAGAQWGAAVEARRERCFERDRYFDLDHRLDGIEREIRDLRRSLSRVAHHDAERL